MLTLMDWLRELKRTWWEKIQEPWRRYDPVDPLTREWLCKCGTLNRRRSTVCTWCGYNRLTAETVHLRSVRVVNKEAR
jgi:hypothetical protein